MNMFDTLFSQLINGTEMKEPIITSYPCTMCIIEFMTSWRIFFIIRFQATSASAIRKLLVHLLMMVHFLKFIMYVFNGCVYLEIPD